ncbi:uncharacterized protein fgl2b [Paramisgurnus dabryanus]|uniref:uncharacterized protein fgl2b n=1 Tax=Paramisgurnus dabryanus TaxID=90735 RepID=UPI0031F3B426
MWLAALYIWGILLAFSACDSCSDPKILKLEPLGNCEDEENFCPYQITLPPLSIQLPRLEKMARELQNLKELVNQLRIDCQECKERQRVERDGWKDHDEEEEEAQTLRHNNNLSGTDQAVRIITSTLPQGNGAEIEGIIRSDVKRINPFSLESHEWNIDRNDADQGTTDQISEMSKEVKGFDLSLEDTSGDTSELRQVFSPITEDIQRGRTFQPDELLESSIPRTKDFVQSLAHGSEVSREVQIFDPSVEETPGDISEVKQVFSPTSEVTHTEQRFQRGELLESSIPRTKDFVQSVNYGNRQPNIFRDRNVKNITGILAMRRRMQNITNANGLGSISGNANTRTISAGNRQLVNFSRTGGPLRPKMYINNRAAKVSDEDRLRNPAVVRTHPQARDKTIRPGPTRNGFSPLRRAGINSGLTLSSQEEKMTVINPNPDTNSGLTTSMEKEKMRIINPNLGTNSGLTLSTQEEKMTVINPNPGTNIGLTLSTEEEKMRILNPNLGTNSERTSSTEEENMRIINPNPGTNSGLTLSADGEELTIINTRPGTGLPLSTEDKKMALINTKPMTNSGLTLSEDDQKITNKKDISTDSDSRTDYENDLKDARQVSADEEENFRKLNSKTKITTTQTNLRKEDQEDVSHTAQITNKSFSTMNRAEQPNLIIAESEHMGTDASLVMSSTDADKANSSSPGRQVERETYPTPNKRIQTVDGHEDLRSIILDITNERQTNPLPPDQEDHTQSGTVTEAVNKEINYNSLRAETVKKTILSDSKPSQLETELVNPTHIPSVRERTASIASTVESPVVNQGTRRILISQPIKPKSGEDIGNILSINSNKNISRIREASNIRFLKNITRVMPKFPIRPGRHPTTVISSGAPKPNTINKISGNSSVVVPSNFPILLRNSSFGRRNGTLMMKPSYVRRRPNLQTEPKASIPNKGFKTNVSSVTQFISSTGKTSDSREENKDIPRAMGSHVLTNLTSTGSKSLPEITRNAGNTLDLETVRHGKDHSSVTVMTSKVGDNKEDSNKDNSLHSGEPDSLSGVEETKQLSLLTTVTSSERPVGVDKIGSIKPQNSRPTASTRNKELSGVSEKNGHEETTKHIPTMTNKHVEIVQDMSQATISPPISFENTVATRELELKEERVQKYSGDVLSNPNTVDDVQGNNGGTYKIPVVLDTLTNVEEIKGSKVFSLSPEDTADGFKAIAVGDDVTQRDGAETKIHSICGSDCINTPTQQPATQSRPLLNSERGRGLPQDCADYMTKTQHNGVYRVTPRSKNSTFQVLCDMETTGGGWTLIQQRFDGSTSFNHTWDEYKKGFGKLTGEFWLGNDKIHWLTQAKNMSLRIELEDFEGVREYAHYDRFHVANESQQYRLSIGGYSGTAGNAMQFNKMYNHDQKLFTTPDRDNDLYPSGNCGVYYSSGWWFDACMSANLNGNYYHTKYKGVRNGIFWGTWHNITMEYYPTNERHSFKTVRMMIRPRNYTN